MPPSVQPRPDLFEQRLQLLWLDRQHEHVRVTHSGRIVRPDGMTRLGQVLELG